MYDFLLFASVVVLLLTGLAFQHLGRVVPQGFIGMQSSLFEEPESDA